MGYGEFSGFLEDFFVSDWQNWGRAEQAPVNWPDSQGGGQPGAPRGKQYSGARATWRWAMQLGWEFKCLPTKIGRYGTNTTGIRGALLCGVM